VQKIATNYEESCVLQARLIENTLEPVGVDCENIKNVVLVPFSGN
jgi:hypothetical protein